MPLRILLVDDHEVVRIGLATLLGRHPGFVVIGETSNAPEAVAKVDELKPDVVVMDIRLPGKNGNEACREIVVKHPATKVIMLTSYAEDELLFDAIAAGASGYVLKQVGSADLVNALERVAKGESLIDPALMHKVLAKVREAARRAEDDAFAKLTEQEMKILALMVEGKTNREIADQIFLSEKTIRNNISTILDKLNISTRSQAIVYAVQHRIRDHMPSE
ncbi:MAG: response regulator transcription factor [Chloroflexi bacterium]|nr:response regulator transcription factor [Chloroflexota bacterium]